MKKNIYIGLCMFLGFLISTFVHASLEISYCLLLWREYEKWSFGISYESLMVFHIVYTVVLILLGLFFGYRMGKFWWAYLYQADGTLKPEFKKGWRI